jgi:hypothetical protein
VLAVWIAMTVDWGWAAGIAFMFAGAVALLRMAGVILAGPLIQQAGPATTSASYAAAIAPADTRLRPVGCQNSAPPYL